jgi:ribosomal protein L44E
MQHHKLADRESPSAHITTNKNKAKVYQNNTIYFNNGQTFEIYIENPTLHTVLAKIWINGKILSDSGIVIHSKSNIYLERFIDEPNKFIFNTFDVDDVIDTYDQRQRNGLIEIEFYKENPITWTHTTNFPPSIWASSTPSLGYRSTTTNTSSISGLINDSTISYTANMAASVETGRVDKGVESSQTFQAYHGRFEDYPLNGMTYHIKPISTKSEEPIDVNDIRYYCTECGYRIRKTSWKYCPKCGEKL